MTKIDKQHKVELDAAVKRDICKAAFRVVARCRPDELGVDIFAMSEIARESGVATGTLYNHFGSKEYLIACVIEESFKDYRKKTAQIVEAVMPVTEKLQAICEYLLSVPIEAHKILYILSIRRQSMPAVQDKLMELNQYSKNAIAAILEEGLRKEIFEEVPLGYLIMAFASIVDTFYENNLLFEETYSIKDQAETIMRLFMNGAKKHLAAQ